MRLYQVKMHNNDKLESEGGIHGSLGCILSSVTGGAVKGESAEECALRELKEETGIDGANLTFICIFADKISNALFYIFLCETDCDKNSIVLQ